MIFQGHIKEQSSKFPHTQFSFPDLLTSHQIYSHRQLIDFINSDATAVKLQNVSRRMKRADYILFTYQFS